MRQRLGDIGAAVPFRALRGVGREAGVGVEQQRPKHHRPALIERKRKSVRAIVGMHRRQAEQIGLDRQRVRVRHVGIGRVRHGRIKPRAVAADAALHRVEKILIAVIADAGVLVGRDIGRIDRPERQRNSQAAGILGASGRGVANHAVGGACEIFAAFDLVRIGKCGGNAGRIGAMIIRQRNRRAAGECHRPGIKQPPADDGRNNQDNNDNEDNACAHDTYALLAAIAARSIGRRRSATPVAA